MILMITYGPHASEHFQWDEFALPPLLEVQSTKPGVGQIGRRPIGVAMYELKGPRGLPPAHFGYTYVGFRAEDDPPLFCARVQE